METWFIYALISAGLSGLVSFLNKISAHHKQDGGYVSFYSSIGGVLGSICLILLNISDLAFPGMVILAGIIGGFTIYFGLIFRIQSLKYIDTTIFFPLYKTFGPFFVIGVSFFIFHESVSFGEGLGLLIGLIVPLFILHRKSHLIKDFNKGIIFMLLCAIVSVPAAYFGKIIYEGGYSIISYLLIVNLMGVGVGGFFQKKKILNISKKNHFGILVGLLCGIIYVFAGWFFIQAMEGNLAIVFSINSFSFLIPILFSVYFYKEHFDWKKGGAIIFTLVSIYLMK